MRTSPPSWIVPVLLAGSVIYSIYLGFRVSDLERKLAERKAGTPADGKATPWPEERGGPVAGVAGPARPASIEARLDTIEDDLAHMQEEYAEIDEQLAGGTTQGSGGAVDENRILDVVTKAQTRVRDRQLEFHGAQWRKARSAMLSDFASRNNLEGWQVEELKTAIDEEIDEAVALLAKPESAENPELVAVEWQKRLNATDVEAMRVLTGPAAEAWMAARMFERQLLWPWLPSLQPQAAAPK